MPYYAVAVGRTTGIYSTWDECSKQVNGYSGCSYKRFTMKADAQKFIGHKPEEHKTATEEHKTATEEHKTEAPVVKPMQTPHSRKIPLESVDANTAIVSFVDGSSLSNGSADSKAGYGVYIPSLKYKVSVKMPDGSTNNQCELAAIRRAIRKVEHGSRHIIVSDSMYSIDCVVTWVQGWKQRGWKKSNGKPIKNLKLIRSIVALLDDNDQIFFSHIHSHTGRSGFLYEGNDVADRLAGMCGY